MLFHRNSSKRARCSWDDSDGVKGSNASEIDHVLRLYLHTCSCNPLVGSVQRLEDMILIKHIHMHISYIPCASIFKVLIDGSDATAGCYNTLSV